MPFSEPEISSTINCIILVGHFECLAPKVNRQEERPEFALVLEVSQTIQINRSHGSVILALSSRMCHWPDLAISAWDMHTTSSGPPLCPTPACTTHRDLGSHGLLLIKPPCEISLLPYMSYPQSPSLPPPKHTHRTKCYSETSDVMPIQREFRLPNISL